MAIIAMEQSTAVATATGATVARAAVAAAAVATVAAAALVPAAMAAAAVAAVTAASAGATTITTVIEQSGGGIGAAGKRHHKDETVHSKLLLQTKKEKPTHAFRKKIPFARSQYLPVMGRAG
jgi:hypothetical protein